MRDSDFLETIRVYDVRRFSETWFTESDCKLLKVNDYNFIHCPGHKYNRRATRHDGGVSVMYKKHLKKGIKLVKICEKGLLWIKFDNFFFSMDKIYSCV